LHESLEARLLFAAGELDPTFGREGTVLTHLSANDDIAYGVAVLPDGKVLASGRTGGNQFSVARYNADGSLDTTFGRGGADGDGVATAPAFTGGNPGGEADEIALLPGGKFLLAGSAGAFSGMMLARFLEDGTLDTTFARGGTDGDGVVVVPFFPGGAGAMVVRPDGRIVLGGSVGDGAGHFKAALARFTAGGELDPTFGPDHTGIVLTALPQSTPRHIPFIFSLANATGGRILASGTTGPDVVLIRYRDDGTLDAGFGRSDADGIDGVVVDDFFRDDVANDMLVQPDGKIVIAGGSGDGAFGQGDAILARYLPSGKRDRTFDGYGAVRIQPGFIKFTAEYARITGLALQPDGKIVAGGDLFAGFPTFGDTFLTRITPSGDFDLTFGGDPRPGFVMTNFDGSSQESGQDLALASDGRIVLVGDSFTGQGSPLLEYGLARYLNDVGLEGTRTYQAELADVSGPVRSADSPGFGGWAYVDFVNDKADFVEFTVDAPAAGPYELSFRYANGSAAARPMGLRVNETLSSGLTFAPTESWRNWGAATIELPLEAGANLVRLVATGWSGPNLDSLSIRPSGPPTAVTYQAEAARLAGPVVASEHPGFTGDGFADYRHAGGDSVEFAVDTRFAGRYDLDFRYANGGSADRPLELRVDGQVVAPRLSFAPTGSWRTWNTVTQSVLLTPGRHAIRLTAVGSSGPNLDELTMRAGSQ
jgi:uncharacterized delta-60 repeat protein